MYFISNADVRESHLANVLQLIDSSERIVICSGWMKMAGLRLIFPSIKAATARGSSIVIYSNASHTGKKCVTALRTLPSVIHILAVSPHLHAKLYYGERAGSFVALIGSANVTDGGLVTNEELSIKLSGMVGDQTHAQIEHYLRQLSGLKPKPV